MNTYKRIILFIALISFLLSCNNSNNGNFNLNANYTKNLKHVNTKYQNVKQQNIKHQNIKQQNIKYENIKYEIEILENTLNENIILEYVIFEVSTKEDLENNIKNKEYSDDFWRDIDWKPILSKFAIGTSVIIITGVLSIATINTPLHIVFLYSFKGSIEGALIGATTGVAINSATQIVLNGGKIDSWQEVLEGAADGYMYGAITGAITGALRGYNIPEMITKNSQNPTVNYKWDIIKKGNKVYKGKFPEFESFFDIKLPKKLYMASDEEQFKYALNVLKARIKRDASLRAKLGKEILEVIENAKNGRINGLTWHHSQKEGVLQLVDREIHRANSHTGGRYIWGGGDLYR